MKVLAVTGGIGCGKSHIVTIFKAMGVPAYDTDSRAKELYDESESLKGSLVKILGDDILDASGRISKDVMAKKIFSNRDLLQRVEGVVHPAVVEDFNLWKESQSNRGSNFVIIESAIFLEKPIFEGVADRVLVVTAPIDLRIKRVQSRSQLSKEQVLERINNQWSDEQRAAMGDFVIHSDESSPLIPQVISIYNQVNNL